jgi:hypothetical protein
MPNIQERISSVQRHKGPELTFVTKTFKDSFIIRHRLVIVFRLIDPIIRNIEVNAVVTGFRDYEVVLRRLEYWFQEPEYAT